VILVLGIALTFASPVFLTKTNIINVLFSSTIIAVVAIGMTFVIIARGIDLSVGSLVSLTSVFAVGLWLKSGWPIWLAIVAAFGIGALAGFVNGFASTKLNISPLIVTLAMLSIAQGAALIYSGGQNIAPVPGVFDWIRDTQIGDVPVVIPFVLFVAVLAHIVLSRTRFGRSVYAVGGNPTAARLAGIHTTRIIIATFVISGLCAALGGVMTSARLASGAATAGEAMLLPVIAAVVIGGTSLFGGEGSIVGTMLGVLLLALVQNAINLLEVPPNYDLVVQGGVIFVAAGLDVYRRRFAGRAGRGGAPPTRADRERPRNGRTPDGPVEPVERTPSLRMAAGKEV
jgi:ribose transport system permease protein